MLPNALARTTLSTNLLAAGLFDVAYGIDVVSGGPFTVRELFIFCAASLAHQGYDPGDVLDELFNESDDISTAALNRTAYIMASLQDHADAAREFGNPEIAMWVGGLRRMIGLRFRKHQDAARKEFVSCVARSAAETN